jgi:hypothetical protein
VRSVGTGEGAGLVTEDLGFEQRFGYGRTIQREEDLLAARRSIVNLPGDDLLADPAFSDDQHATVDLGCTADEIPNLVRRPTSSQKSAGVVLAIDFHDRGPRCPRRSRDPDSSTTE